MKPKIPGQRPSNGGLHGRQLREASRIKYVIIGGYFNKNATFSNCKIWLKFQKTQWLPACAFPETKLKQPPEKKRCREEDGEDLCGCSSEASCIGGILHWSLLEGRRQPYFSSKASWLSYLRDFLRFWYNLSLPIFMSSYSTLPSLRSTVSLLLFLFLCLSFYIKKLVFVCLQIIFSMKAARMPRFTIFLPRILFTL